MGLSKPKKPEEEKTEKHYTDFELNTAEKAINDAGSEEQWLVDNNAIRINEDGQRVVLRQADGSIKYKEMQDLYEAVMKRIRRRKYAEERSIFEQTGEWPVNEGFKKLKDRINNVGKI